MRALMQSALFAVYLNRVSRFISIYGCRYASVVISTWQIIPQDSVLSAEERELLFE